MGAGPSADRALVLASRSPRRALLLRQIGVEFEVRPAQLEETPRPAEPAAAFVQRMALAKARAAALDLGPARPVLGADTVVVLDGRILGKPGGAGEAERFLEALSGRSHEVLSAVALTGPRTEVRLCASRVWLRPIAAAERARYCATPEPLDKAGGYAIQGLGAVFVRHLEGSYSGVMGLPLFETSELLRGAGIEVL